MSSISSKNGGPDAEFAARLQRIKARDGAMVLHAGDEQHVVHRKKLVQQSRQAEIAGNLMFPLSLLGALALGLVAVAMGRYARFHLAAGWGDMANPEYDMLVSGLLGLMLAFVLGQMFRLRSKEHRGMMSAGVFLMVCTFHNLAHWAPGPMSMMFSPAWVQTVVATSPANSFAWRGMYVPFGEQTVELAVAEPEADLAVPAAAEGAAAATGDCAKPAVTIVQLDNAKAKPAKSATKDCAENP